MKTIKAIFFTLSLLTAMTSCEKDGDKIYLNSPKEGELIGTTNEIVLKQEVSKQIVLSLAWTQNNLSVSNANMQAPNVLSTILQVSANENFSDNMVKSVESSLSKAYTGGELNTVAKNLGAKAGVATTLYFRVQTTLGNNIDPVYSTTFTVKVTPYLIDMTVGFVLDKDQAATSLTLYSPNSDGVYTGFMGVTSWYNYFLKEGDGTIWGNDGIDGKAFLMSSEDSHWNFWFPGLSGCYYVKIDTGKKVWSALAIPTLTVSGDITGEMTFDRTSAKWIYAFTAANAGDTKIKIGGTGKQYDYNTGDANATDTPVGFSVSNGSIAFTSQPGDITINIPSTGECTLELDLSNPKAWTCQVIRGNTKPEEVRKEIFLSGIDDKTVGSWTFDNKLSLYNEDKLAYSGVAYASSAWGYKIYPESGNWDEKYIYASGDANVGTIMKFDNSSDANLPAPADGLYLFDISLNDLTYKLTAIGDKIYYSGLNDDWTFHELSATATTGVYSGSINITAASTNGFRLYLLNGDWNTFYGGADGKLTYISGHIKDDATWGTGSHTLTVNLKEGTYSIN